MRGLVLDFDGVIADSAPEAFAVALATYARLFPESALPGRDRAQVYRRFLEIMPLGNRAEDYCAGLRAIEADLALPDQAAYDAWFREQAPPLLRSFHRRFYREREAFAKRDPRRWRELIRPYPAFLALLRRRAPEVALAIATAKDRRSVGRLLSQFGIADLFAEGRVLDKETGVSKAAHLEHLQAELRIPFDEMTFLDDKVNHLDAVAPLGVRCALAAWGYNGVREHLLARERGHLVCRLEDAEQRLFG